MRRLLATACSLVISFNTMLVLVLQRLVAEIDDGERAADQPSAPMNS